MVWSSCLSGRRVCACATACETARLCCAGSLEAGRALGLVSTRLRVIGEGSPTHVSACEVYFRVCSSNKVGNLLFLLQVVTLAWWHWQRFHAAFTTSPEAIMDTHSDDGDADLFGSPEVHSPPTKMHRVNDDADGTAQNLSRTLDAAAGSDASGSPFYSRPGGFHGIHTARHPRSYASDSSASAFGQQSG